MNAFYKFIGRLGDYFLVAFLVTPLYLATRLINRDIRIPG